MPSLSDVLEAIAGEAADIVEVLNRAFETSRPVRSALISPLEKAIVESQTYDLEVEDVPGPVVEILQEMVHEPITLQVERATGTARARGGSSAATRWGASGSSRARARRSRAVAGMALTQHG